MITQVTDWPAQLRALVFAQFVQSNWGYPTANAIGGAVQPIEDAAIAMLSLWSIDPVTNDPTSAAYGIGRGVQLDRIGALVGEQRASLADAQYRLALRARILVNRSHGSPDELIAIAKAAVGGSTSATYTPGWVCEYTLGIVGAVDPIDAPVVVDLVGQATIAGVRGVVEWSPVATGSLMLVAAPGYASAGTSGRTISNTPGGIYLGALAGAAQAA